MRNMVVSDTSCLILFHKIGELDILRKVYESVTTTPEVAEEFGYVLPDWIRIENVKPIIEKLQATNFRISENIIEELLRKNNETNIAE